MNNLTPDEYEQFARALGNRLSEHFEGFALVGFHAITKEPVVFSHADNIKTRHALNDLLRSAIAPVPVIKPDPEPPNGKTSA